MRKINIFIVSFFIVFYGYSQSYFSPKGNEEIYISGRTEDIASNDYIWWDDLIAWRQNSPQVLISIPLGERHGLSHNKTWLTRKYLYFYLLGNERLNDIKLKKFAKENSIQKKSFGEGEDGWEVQQKYVITHGMDLFRFDLQTGEFSNTGFTLHSMDFAVSPDDSRICVRAIYLNTSDDKLAMYDLNDGSCINDDLLKKHSEIGKNGDFMLQCRSFCYGNLYDTSARCGDLQQIWPDLIWSFGAEYPDWAGKINWKTCAVEIYNFTKEKWKPNYYVSDGPLNIRSDAGLEGKKMFFYKLPAGAKVLVTETGKTETIDGITAPWVWIWTENANIFGWVFSGYLKKIQ
jgi:hypothetical protein